MKILYRGVLSKIVSKFEDGPKIDGFGGLDRENCECQSSDPPRKSNYAETRHPVQKVRRYSQKCVLQSLARKAIKRKKEKKRTHV